MADDITVDNGSGTDYDVATDDDGSGNHIQIVKLAQSADGTRTPITADSDGMLVNLGANNDVVISDGGNTITVDGTVAVTNAGLTELAAAIDTELQVDVVGALPAGTNNIGDVDILSIAAGDNNIGNVDVVSLPASTNTIEVVGDAAHDAAATGNPVLIGAEFDDSTPDSVDEGDVGRLRISANRNLYSTIRDAAGNERGANVNASNQLAVSVDNTVTVASHAVTNAGTFATQVDGAALTALQLIDDIVRTDDAAFAPGTDEVAMAGFFADESSTDSVDEGDGGAARMTLDRKQIVTVQPHTAGGWDVKNCSSSDGATALTSTAQEVKASAGKLGGYYIYNPNSSAQFVQIYNTASGSVTVGTTNPLLMLTIPATSAANLEMVNGLTFGTAIAVAATSTAGGNGAPSTALDAIFFYK